MIPQSKNIKLTKQLFKRSILGKPTVVLADAAKLQAAEFEKDRLDEINEDNPSSENEQLYLTASMKYHLLSIRQAEIYGKSPYFEYVNQQKST